MFPLYPGFEEFPIYIEIEWQGRKRPVLVRMEQLPTQPVQAVPVCSFLDAPEVGEWLLVSNKYDVYTLGNPYNLLRVGPIFRGVGVEKGKQGEQIELRPKHIEKLRQTIENAVNAEVGGVRVLRVIQLPQLPQSPHLAFLSEFEALWCDAWRPTSKTSFIAPQFGLDKSAAEIRRWVQKQWENIDSDVRFAWEWANRSDDERTLLSFGWRGDLNQRIAELELVMRLILLSHERLWDEDSEWQWRLSWGKDNGKLRGLENWIESDALLSWQEWLWSHFFSCRRADWLETHPCVRWFWMLHTICNVEVSGPPSLHERLEARLQLHEWLQENAPDRMNLLEQSG